MPATTGRNGLPGNITASTAASILLNCIDSPRPCVRTSRKPSCDDLYSFASFGKLRFKNEYEQDLWSECSRLIANCIIFYNASILSRLLEHKENAGGQMQAIDEIKKISPIAWQHVNFHGRYEFQKGFLNLDAIIQGLAEWAPPSGRPHQQLN
jgi:hypothetical protein